MKDANLENPPVKVPFRFPVPSSRLKHRNAFTEHRQAQRQRCDEAASLAQKYPQLKSLKLSLEFINRDGVTKHSHMKYSANPEHAKSVLVFVCPIPDCFGGDFDLTAKLAETIAARRSKASGKLFCLGSHRKGPDKLEPCRSELHYTLTLAYT